MLTFFRHNPSQADVSVYESLKGAKPDVTKYPHSARWYKHIAHHANDHPTFPGEKKEAKSYLPAAGAAAAVGAGAGAVGASAAADKGKAAEEDEDDIDLFGSDDEEVDEEAEKLKQQRLAEYAAKKANKPKTIAKSVVTMEVKPWDDETDMKALEAFVRSVEQDGLVWGASKLVAVGFGIKKLQITLVIEDEKVSLDELQEKLADEGEEYIQSSDIAAMQKL